MMSALARALSFMPKADISLEVEIYINVTNFLQAVFRDRVLSFVFLHLTNQSLSLVLLLDDPKALFDLNSSERIMSSNQIIKSVNVATVTKGGKQVILAVATQTQKWERTESIARSQQSGFRRSVMESPTTLPAGTAKVVSRSVPYSP